MTGPQTKSKAYLSRLRQTAQEIGMGDRELYQELQAHNKPELAQMLVEQLQQEGKFE